MIQTPKNIESLSKLTTHEKKILRSKTQIVKKKMILKKCKFCHHFAKYVKCMVGGKLCWYVKCTHCDHSLNQSYSDSILMAATCWNNVNTPEIPITGYSKKNQ